MVLWFLWSLVMLNWDNKKMHQNDQENHWNQRKEGRKGLICVNWITREDNQITQTRIGWEMNEEILSSNRQLNEWGDKGNEDTRECLCHKGKSPLIGMSHLLLLSLETSLGPRSAELQNQSTDWLSGNSGNKEASHSPRREEIFGCVEFLILDRSSSVGITFALLLSEGFDVSQHLLLDCSNTSIRHHIQRNQQQMSHQHHSCARHKHIKEEPHHEGLEPSRLTRLSLGHGEEIHVEQHPHVHQTHKQPAQCLRYKRHTFHISWSRGRRWRHRVSLRFRWQHFSTHSAAQVSHEQIQQSLPLRFLLTGHLVNKQLLRSLFEPTTGTHDTLHFLTNQRQLSSFNKLCWATDWDLSKREWCWMNFVVSRFRPHESVNSWQQSFVDNLSRWLFISFKIFWRSSERVVPVFNLIEWFRTCRDLLMRAMAHKSCHLILSICCLHWEVVRNYELNCQGEGSWGNCGDDGWQQ